MNPVTKKSSKNPIMDWGLEERSEHFYVDSLKKQKGMMTGAQNHQEIVIGSKLRKRTEEKVSLTKYFEEEYF